MTDRTLKHLADLAVLRFDDRGLVPVVAQDARGGAVLMVAWANREALALSLETGFMHYWSRSREALWKKGETSGNLQTVVSLHADCDADTVLARVTMDGPACHTGEGTCFGELPGGEVTRGSGVLDELWGVLQDRDRDRPEGSWTTRLLSDETLRLKELGEETVELVTALVRGDDRASEEAADLVYHIMVALKGAGREWDEVLAELARRRR
ncbi:bifunctional phosphoribosyl-AMP cyclohydrolase/phosphoribosyl-ATP diphosphatase HisIE [soil metagenome]